MLKAKLQDDQIKALKSQQSDQLEFLRYILAQIKNKEIEKQGELTEEETVTVLQKIAKELQESLEASKTGDRQDLIGKYQKQLDIISSYLPAQLSDEELQKEIETLIEKNKDLYEKNPKAIIGICMKELRSKADPSRIMSLLDKLK